MKLHDWKTFEDGSVTSRRILSFGATKGSQCQSDLLKFVRSLHAAYERGEILLTGEPMGDWAERRDPPCRYDQSPERLAKLIGEAVAQAMAPTIDMPLVFGKINPGPARTVVPIEELDALRDVASAARRDVASEAIGTATQQTRDALAALDRATGKT